MKRIASFILFGVLLTLASCYKDLGNYEYVYPEEPVVTGIQDSVFVAFISDSLHIKPTFKHSLAKTDNFSFEWKIMVPYKLKEEFYTGPELHIKFGLKPGLYKGRFTVTDHSNGMKYFYPFSIAGKTEFTSGTVVLSDQAGMAQLSFIKLDNTLLPGLYETLNKEALPPKPIQLLAVDQAWNPGNTQSYWVVCAEGEKPGVIVDASSMLRKKYINDNFFNAPTTIKPGFLKSGISGTTRGVINDRLYLGTSNTDPAGSLYGMYGIDAGGDYTLSPHFIFVEFQYYIGYDVKKKRFVRFDANATYYGTDYNIIPVGPGFDPAKVGLDLMYMQYLSSDASYAFGKDATGKIYELKFSNAPGLFFTYYMREFKGKSLVKENTQWLGSALEMIYFTSADKIYRYNPINEEIKPLSTDFGGKEVSMLKLSVTGDTLITGTEGKLYYLDISTGKNGTIINTVDGIPGKPVDVVIRK